jgi:SAM-dependent methyltransferase
MDVFGSYSQYYDLLYQDKNYQAESDFICQLIDRYRPNSRSILELGCGTGIHASLLADRGYQVHGVDLSADMLSQAEAKASQKPDGQLSFSLGDAKTVRLDRSFDVVLSLFHVVSYHQTNADLVAAFETAKCHLNPGGIFVFDVWYGPAVLADRPTVRVKRLENDRIQVMRIAEPDIYPNLNRVDVNYQIQITDKQTGNVETVKETHPMRYLFKPELEFVADRVGLTLLHCGEWLSDAEPGFDSWGAFFVMQAL